MTKIEPQHRQQQGDAMTDLTFDEVGEGARVAARRYSYAGAAFIALAFLGPPLATAFGLGNAFTVGEDVARTLGSLLFLAGVSWLVTRGRSNLAKAKGRLVVGILLCIVVGNNIANAAREGQVARDFMRGALDFDAKQSAKFIDLGRRFEEITVNQYVTPQALTSQPSMAAAQAALERYRSLLQERNLLLETHTAEWQAFLATVPPGEARRGAEATAGPAMEAARNMFKGLDVAQRAHADALGAVFNWAQANAGKLSMKGNQLMFQTAQQQSELAALAAKLQEAENAVGLAAKAAAAEQQRAAARRETALREGKAFLAK